jgi:5-methylcytosine-specific restriction endonuclease McrA
MKYKTQETYKGQRSKEKRELFKRFRIRAIEDVYKNKFFALFDHRCFKCGIKEKPYDEIGQPPVLCIDHNVPMILGGHLNPGNLVALCRSCNNKKSDLSLEEFYTPEELYKLKPLLEKQLDIFDFIFDWNYWNRDPQDYLLSLGVESNLIHELLYNQEHPDYIGMPSNDTGVKITISVDIADIYDNTKNND